MNEFLIQRLKEFNIQIQDILNLIKFNENDGVLIYTSHMEGLGTKGSDFDIYVICDYIPELELVKKNKEAIIKNYYINGVQLDVEYWTMDYIYLIIKKLNENKISLDELKFLYRMIKGEVIYNENKFLTIKKHFSIDIIKERLLKIYLDICKGALDDALNMYNNDDYVSAIVSGRKALDYAMAVVNTMNNNLTCKMKWTPKLLLNSLGENNKLVQQYLSLQVFCKIDKDNIKSYVEDVIGITQDIISSASFL